MVAATDTRPRFPYVLPDGTRVQVIHDHGEQPKPVITFQLKGGQVVNAVSATAEGQS